MKWFTLTLSLLMFSMSCGKKVSSSDTTAKTAKAETLINERKYEDAITLLEILSKDQPNDDELKIKLLHAYAGAGSFEALKVVDIWKRMDKEIRRKGPKERHKDLELQGRSFLKRLTKILAPIPELSKREAERLNHAIELYQELGLRVETAGEYKNFKWGTLHIYRLAVNAKAITNEINRSLKVAGKVDAKAIERVVLERLSMIGQDIFMAYRLYGNSFHKIQKLTESIDKLIAKAVEDKNFRLKVDETINDQAEFYLDIADKNIEAAAVLIKKVGNLYNGKGLQRGVDSFLKLLPRHKEINESEENISELIKTYIRLFTEKHPEFEEKIRSLFNDDLKDSFVSAARASLKQKNTLPLKAFFSSKEKDIQVVVGYYRILTDDIKESDLEGSIRDQIEPLKKKVSLERLKAEYKRIQDDLKIEHERLINEGNGQRSSLMNQLEARLPETLDKINQLKKELGPLQEIGPREIQSSPAIMEQDDQEEDDRDSDYQDDTNDLVE